MQVRVVSAVVILHPGLRFAVAGAVLIFHRRGRRNRSADQNAGDFVAQRCPFIVGHDDSQVGAFAKRENLFFALGNLPLEAGILTSFKPASIAALEPPLPLRFF